MADDAPKKPIPDGVFSVFLTMSTQEKFNCREREHVTEEKPYVGVAKQFFLDDIQFRGVISDFHPCKKKIEAYPEDELLVVWDAEEDYGNNYYLIYTVAARKKFLEELEAAKEVAEEAGGGGGGGGTETIIEEYKPPESKEWVTQVADAELAEEAISESREKIVVRLSRPRKEYGVAYKFTDRDANEDPNITHNDCRPYKDPNFELRRREHDTGVQAVPEVDDAHSQTTWFRPLNKGVQYDARTMTAEQVEATQHSAAFKQFLVDVRERYEQALQQNETVDVFQDDFATLAEDEAGLGNKSDSELRELQSFHHLQYCSGRVISCSDWQPRQKGVVAVSCAQRLTFEERVLVAGKVSSGYILLWNFTDPIHPQFVLEAPGDVYCFRFCPSNPSIVVAGLASGQVVAWDLAEASKAAAELKSMAGESGDEAGSHTITAQPYVQSAVEHSHRRTITDVVWLPSTLDMTEKGKLLRRPDTGAEQREFMTIAADGQVLFWDLNKAAAVLLEEQKQREEKEKEKTRKEGWGPTHRISLTHPDSNVEPSMVHVIFDVPENADEPCRLFAVTEDGEIVLIDLANPGADSTRGVRSVTTAHHGPCTALRRSPHIPDVHLSVGDWCFHLWKEGVSSPLFSAPFASCLLTCGAWSPTRPAVVFVGRADGSIDVWDLLDRSHEPSMSVAITSAAVTSIEFHSSATKQLLAVGDDQGTVHVMEVSLAPVPPVIPATCDPSRCASAIPARAAADASPAQPAGAADVAPRGQH